MTSPSSATRVSAASTIRRGEAGRQPILAGGVRDCELAQGQMGRGRFAHGWSNDFEFIARRR